MAGMRTRMRVRVCSSTSMPRECLSTCLAVPALCPRRSRRRPGKAGLVQSSRRMSQWPPPCHHQNAQATSCGAAASGRGRAWMLLQSGAGYVPRRRRRCQPASASLPPLCSRSRARPGRAPHCCTLSRSRPDRAKAKPLDAPSWRCGGGMATRNVLGGAWPWGWSARGRRRTSAQS